MHTVVRMPSKIDKIIHRIEKIVEQKADEIENNNYQKYKTIFDMTIRFLQKKELLLYGGFAINELMPASLKIYKKNTLPDIDFFTYKPKEIATYLVKQFRNAGYDTSSFSEALHPGTFKVFVHGLQVADITGVSKTAFQRLSKDSVKGASGLPIVDPQYLRMTLHVLMSQAIDSHRWPKVFARLISFYKIYPPKKCVAPNSEPKPLPRGLLDDIYRIVEKEKYVVFGANELKLMLHDHEAHNHSMPPLQMITDPDPEHVATYILKQIPSFDLHVHVYKKDDFVPKHVIIKYGSQYVAAIYQADACITFNDLRGLRVASIHTMLRMYLAMTFSDYRHFKNFADDLECITSSLSYLQQTLSKHKQKRILKEFITECYGTQPGLVTMRREKLLRMI